MSPVLAQAVRWFGRFCLAYKLAFEDTMLDLGLRLGRHRRR